MASLVELDESNGGTEVVTHGVTSLAMGTMDVSGMIPGAPGARQPVSSNGMQKSLRVHLTGLGGGSGIAAVRVSCDPSEPGWSLHANANDDPTEYDAAKRTTYVPPATSTGAVPYALPTSDPGSGNLGIGGDLEGTLAAPGWTDYLYLQLRAAADAVAGFTSPCFFAYDDLG